MTKFEQVGVNYQYNATNVEDANKFFEYSCNCCCTKGRQFDCSRCAIAVTHNNLCAYFSDKENTMKGKWQHGNDRP